MDNTTRAHENTPVGALADAAPGSEYSLAESAELTTLYDSAPVGLAFLDTDLCYVRVSDMYAQMAGIPAGEIVGKHLREVATLAVADAVEPLYRQVLATRQPSPQMQVTGVSRAGAGEQRTWVVSYHPVLESGTGALLGVEAVVLDVTDIRRTEHSLRESEEQYRALVEGVPDYAIYLLDPEGRVASWNAGAERTKGYTSQEVIGRHFSMFYTPEDRVAGKPERALALAAEQGSYAEHNWRIRKDGSYFYANVVLTALQDEQGKIRGFALAAHDMTERARLESESQRRALTLETVNRVALDILGQETGVDALRHIAEAARTLAGARYAALGVARLDGNGLQEFIATGLTEEEKAVIGTLPSGKGILGLLLTRSEPIRIGTLADHPASVGFPPNHPPMGSFLGVPIRRGETVLGSLYLTNKIGGAGFTKDDEVAVQALGAHAAVAIHHLHLLARQRALLSGLINAQEEERRSVAYDLHDGLTQYVMAARAHLDVFYEIFRTTQVETGSNPDTLGAAELDQGRRYLQEAVLESRRLVNGLRALALDDLGLSGALEQLLNEEKVRAGWEAADLLHNIAGRRFDGTLETTIFRVAQEALTNARKHAAASRVRVTLLYEEKVRPKLPSLTLEVQDSGKGFIPEECVTPDSAHGFGLHSMIERIHLMGGQCELESAPGEGTRLRAMFPVIGH